MTAQNKQNTMKKILVAFAFAASLSACHYGQNEAKKTLEVNDQYKADKADYSVNRANVKAADQTAAPVAADTAAVAAPAVDAPAK